MIPVIANLACATKHNANSNKRAYCVWRRGFAAN